MMLSIFSYAYLPTAYHIWWGVIWDHLPVFNCLLVFLLSFKSSLHIFLLSFKSSLDKNLYQICLLQKFSPSLWLFFSIFLKISDINISHCCARTTNESVSVGDGRPLNRPGQGDTQHSLIVLHCSVLQPERLPDQVCSHLGSSYCVSDTALQTQLRFHWAWTDPQNEAFTVAHRQRTL